MNVKLPDLLAALLIGVSLLIPLSFSVGAISGAVSMSLMATGLLVLTLSRCLNPWIRRLAIAALLLTVPISGMVVVIFALIEQGETVILRTFDEHQTAEETRLWVIDWDGYLWLGAGGGTTRRWYQRLIANPNVELVRNGVTDCFTATPVHDSAVRDSVVGLTREKYRYGNLGLSFGNRLGIPMRDSSIAIPIRLATCDDQVQPNGGDNQTPPND